MSTARCLAVAILAFLLTDSALADDPVGGNPSRTVVLHKTVKVGNLDIFYREAGSPDAPTLLLLHGFPTSSQMFRNLLPALADRYHLIAPDYPGYGYSSMPSRSDFDYTFDNLATMIDAFTVKIGIEKFALYVQDYGAPIGYRLAAAHPERITAIVVQNGNAYDEGLDNEFWKPIKAYWKEPKSQQKRDAIRGLLTYESTRWQYTTGAPNPELVSPDGAAEDQFLLNRKGNDEIQLDLFLSYGSNPPLYPKWQAYFRKHQPPMLIVWGKNDQIFPPAGAEPYKRDLKVLEYHLLDAGHFALETHGDEIASRIREFLGRHLVANRVTGEAMQVHRSDTAVVIIDPQNEVLSESGAAWGVVGESVEQNGTIRHIERIFDAAKKNGFEVFISPHYFYPTDQGWKSNGPLENMEHENKMFARRGTLSLEGFPGSGADWLERFKPYIEDGKTVVVSPHRVWGSQTNDLVLQLRKRGISKVILGGMLANICVESHLRDLLEQGFEVYVVADATAGPRHPKWGYGYTAAMINFQFLAHAVLETDEIVDAMSRPEAVKGK